MLASEQDRPDVAAARDRWRRHQPAFDPERLVFIDETWTKTNMARARGRCRRGRRLIGRVPHGHWKTTTFVAALRHDGIAAPFVIDRPMNGGILRTYVERILAVIHFADSIVVPESVEFPLKYYLNNTSASRNLIQACIDTGVDRFIYSSTAAVYGPPKDLPVAEDAPTIPLNPYGRSKLMTEWILQDAGAAHGLRYLCLRYFNVVGADPLGRAGQLNPNATHLIKVASQAVVGLRDGIEVFGEDYETPDGTCIRDYIHVTDLATAHVNALRYLEAGGQSQILNCGYGRGYSIKQVLRTVEEMSGLKLKICLGPRRPGDVPALVTDSRKIRDTLAWRPTYDNLATVVETAIRWERALTSAPKDNEGAQ